MALRLLKYGRQAVITTLRAGFNGTWSPSVHLYQSNITPTQDDTDSTYTGSEANFSGYAALTTSSWSATTTSGEQEQTVASSLLFQVGSPATTGNQIYGYIMNTGLGGITQIYWAERFAGAPLSMTVSGDAIVLIPQFSMQSQFA